MSRHAATSTLQKHRSAPLSSHARRYLPHIPLIGYNRSHASAALGAGSQEPGRSAPTLTQAHKKGEGLTCVSPLYRKFTWPLS